MVRPVTAEDFAGVAIGIVVAPAAATVATTTTTTLLPLLLLLMLPLSMITDTASAHHVLALCKEILQILESATGCGGRSGEEQHATEQEDKHGGAACAFRSHGGRHWQRAARSEMVCNCGSGNELRK